MTLAIRLPKASAVAQGFRDYLGYVSPFLARVERRRDLPVMLGLKSIEWAVYRWYRPREDRAPGLPPVRHLIFKITSHCTDSCAKCGVWREPEESSSRVSVERVERCLEDLGGNVGSFTVTGGEPLLMTGGVLRLARTARGLGVPMTVMSNGVLLTPAFLDEFAGLGHALVISIDTMDPGRWPLFRGRSHQALVMQNLMAARKALGPNLVVQSVLAAETREDVPAVARFCAENRIRHVLQRWADFGGGWSAIQAGGTRPAQACGAWQDLCVAPDGTVTRCFDHRRLPVAQAPLGHLAWDSIGAILARERTRQVTAAHRACRLPCAELACYAEQ